MIDLKICLIIVIIFIYFYTFNKSETYYNMYGDYIDAPFLEKTDKECRNLCNNMADCEGYNYDSLTGTCYLNSKNDKYMKPYYDHFMYPYYDRDLYKYGWWMYGPLWMNGVLFKQGYRNNLYGGHKVHHYKKNNGKSVGLIKGGENSRINADHNGKK